MSTRRTVTLDSAPEDVAVVYVYQLVYEFKSSGGRGRPQWKHGFQYFTEYGKARSALNNMVEIPIYRNVSIKVVGVTL